MSRRTVKKWKGFEQVEMVAELHMEPEIVDDRFGSPEFRISVLREKSSGTTEVTDLRVRLPRDTVTRLLEQIRKRIERERAQIAADLTVLPRQ